MMTGRKSPRTADKIGVLFVCLGNICRSPAAEGTFRHFVATVNQTHRFDIDSAGTSAFHSGEPANANSQRAARKHGIALESRARQFQVDDFDRFDYILAMDAANFQEIHRLARTEGDRERVFLFRQFDPEVTGSEIPDVPDPYYGGAAGFDRVQDIMNRTVRNLFDHVARERAR